MQTVPGVGESKNSGGVEQAAKTARRMAKVYFIFWTYELDAFNLGGSPEWEYLLIGGSLGVKPSAEDLRQSWTDDAWFHDLVAPMNSEQRQSRTNCLD